MSNVTLKNLQLEDDMMVSKYVGCVCINVLNGFIRCHWF